MCCFEKQSWKPFHYYRLCHLPRCKKLPIDDKGLYPSVNDFYVNNMCDKSQCQKNHTN